MRRVYPPDVFPGAWAKLDSLADSGLLVSNEEVLEELNRQEDRADEVCEWARCHVVIFHALDGPIQERVREILRSHPNLVDLKRRKSGADPFVVAHAILEKCAVVTEENPSGGPNKVKIPDVCKAYNIECIKVLEMFRRETLRL
ncbi:MAG: DUF4411 family protein [Pirellulales bacterium]|nr:DUF4411 family protein [Pirellulales bacterium]